MCARGDKQTLISPGLRAAWPLLPPAPLHLIIILAGLRLIIILATARARIASLGVALEKGIVKLGVPIALEIARLGLEKEPGAVVTPGAAARNGDIDRRPARHKAALGLVVQHH